LKINLKGREKGEYKSEYKEPAKGGGRELERREEGGKPSQSERVQPKYPMGLEEGEIESTRSLVLSLPPRSLQKDGGGGSKGKPRAFPCIRQYTSAHFSTRQHM
jgi:hypothetical protein